MLCSNFWRTFTHTSIVSCTSRCLSSIGNSRNSNFPKRTKSLQKDTRLNNPRSNTNAKRYPKSNRDNRNDNISLEGYRVVTQEGDRRISQVSQDSDKKFPAGNSKFYSSSNKKYSQERLKQYSRDSDQLASDKQFSQDGDSFDDYWAARNRGTTQVSYGRRFSGGGDRRISRSKRDSSTGSRQPNSSIENRKPKIVNLKKNNTQVSTPRTQRKYVANQLSVELPKFPKDQVLQLLNREMTEYAQKNEIEKMLILYDHIKCSKVCDPDHLTFETMIKCFLNNSDFLKALHYLDEMEHIGLDIDTIGRQMLGQTPRAIVALAEKFFYDTLSPGVGTLNVILRCLFRSQNIAGTLGFLDDLDQRGVTLNEVTFKIIINTLISSEKFSFAKKYINQMIACGFGPDPSWEFLNQMKK